MANIFLSLEIILELNKGTTSQSSEHHPHCVASPEDQGARATSPERHQNEALLSLSFFSLPVLLLQPLPGTNLGSFTSQCCLASKISFSFHPLGFPSHSSFFFYFCPLNIFPSLAFSVLLCSFPHLCLPYPRCLIYDKNELNEIDE